MYKHKKDDEERESKCGLGQGRGVKEEEEGGGGGGIFHTRNETQPGMGYTWNFLFFNHCTLYTHTQHPTPQIVHAIDLVFTDDENNKLQRRRVQISDFISNYLHKITFKYVPKIHT